MPKKPLKTTKNFTIPAKLQPTVAPAVTTKNTLDVKFDPERHCGHMYPSKIRGREVRCLALKGQGTTHPGVGKCELHTDKTAANYYLSVRPTRLHYLLQRVQEEGGDPCDILRELEILRAMTIAFIEDNSDLARPEVILQASDLLSKIMKGAQQYQSIKNAETIHIKSVELIHVQMAEIMMRVIQSSGIDSLAADRIIDKIKNQWGTINIETNPKEARKGLAVRQINNQSESIIEVESELVEGG